MDFNEIYKMYFEDVYRFILNLSGNKEIAEDVTQETFIKAIKGIKNFDGSCKLTVWLCQIAKNTYYTYLKKHSKIKTTELIKAENLSSGSGDMDSRLRFLEIHKALHDMPEPYREVFTLKVFGDLTHGEIGQLFGKTESWAKVTYLRAKEKLQKIIKEEE